MSDQKVVLITGASSGVGQATARLLSQRGYRVFGTSRNLGGAEPIAGVEMLPLDVRTDHSVRTCVHAVFDQGGRLDVLINNAGYELAGALEELSSEEVRAQFETNFFGAVRMVNAVLPLMRRQKRGADRHAVLRLPREPQSGTAVRGRPAAPRPSFSDPDAGRATVICPRWCDE